jgi:hypothetical protein
MIQWCHAGHGQLEAKNTQVFSGVGSRRSQKLQGGQHQSPPSALGRHSQVPIFIDLFDLAEPKIALRPCCFHTMTDIAQLRRRCAKLAGMANAAVDCPVPKSLVDRFKGAKIVLKVSSPFTEDRDAN